MRIILRIMNHDEVFDKDGDEDGEGEYDHDKASTNIDYMVIFSNQLASW